MPLSLASRRCLWLSSAFNPLVSQDDAGVMLMVELKPHFSLAQTQRFWAPPGGRRLSGADSG
jgi:hypothetical protein